jgi:ribonuclease-3
MTDIATLEANLGITFRNRALLEQALTHRSYLNECGGERLASNERLEFLGDAALGYFAADYLYATYPEMSEGDMTTLRAALVRGETLARWARSLDLGSYLYLGRGEANTGGRDRPALLASAFEALIAAVILDQGEEAGRALVLRFLAPEAEQVRASQTAKDFKSRLQEVVQAARQVTPTYRLVGTSGPDHALTFVAEVLAGDVVLGRGEGASKQQAEQEAARAALAVIENSG